MPSRHFIPANEEEEIAAVHHEADSEKWIFLCHGFGGNKDRGNKFRAEYLNKKGWNVVRFDFRGNGESDSDFIDQGLSSRIQDLKNVVENFRPDSYALFGTSFGGKVVLHAANELENVNCILLKAPVTYNSIMSRFRKAVQNKGEFEYIEGKPIDKQFFDDFSKYSFSEVLDLETPIAIIHGRKDTTVHIENSFNAIEDLDTDATLYALEGEKHSFSDKGDEKVCELLESWLSVYY